MNTNYCIGIDFGTDSVRSIIVDAYTGEEVAAAVHLYSRWNDGLYCDPNKNQFRQHPLDYIDGLEQTIKKCLSQVGNAVRTNIKAISVDTTGSTPVAVDETGTPLALLPGFEANPNAMFVLWKDHTAVPEATAINQHAAAFGEDYLKYVGGIYSSEWYWAKLLHILKNDQQVRKACYSWVEHCDWIPFLLTGGGHVRELKRSVCTAGHKGLWATAFDGLPPKNFFSSLDPLLASVYDTFPEQVYTADQQAGYLSKEWAERLGLPDNVVIGVGAMDAHMGAVGGQIEPYYLSKVMGTSTCDMLVIPKKEFEGKIVKGICGQVDGSIIPGMIGLEAGQSAFGDIYAWFKQLLSWPLQHLMMQSDKTDHEASRALFKDISDRMLHELSKQAAAIAPSEHDELALDWLNGRRTPDADQSLKGAISGLTLASDAPRIFRSLVESTCFGARKIVERFQEEGVPIKGLIGVGGIAQKSPFVMQMLADVMQMPLKIHRSEQTCALGAAMFAATVAGIYPTVEEAMKAMGTGFDRSYVPDKSKAAYYDKRYQQYLKLGDFLETSSI
ncbi:ribulokinase [Olivibacter sp. SDN3]|uniref:ribulokinase n=1 Tax=Olivibacter sp. SDN3 TaxID=2764720 RepID=UPI0016515DDF|nr:ribulokinase [Olivibacter sp. SDN3]QNL50573.1 ribulokinase [Olivibacter sp. SDN3]